MDCYCDECWSSDEPETPDRMGPVSIAARKVTVYQVNGRGKRWSNRAAAYRAAARAIVWNACLREHDVGHYSLIPEGKACRYCSKECEGHKSLRHYVDSDLWDQPSAAKCSDTNNPTHTYRYRLVTRLTRWLKWRDEQVQP